MIKSFPVIAKETDKKLTNLYKSGLNFQHNEVVIKIHVMSSCPQENSIRGGHSNSHVEQIGVSNQTKIKDNLIQFR